MSAEPQLTPMMAQYLRIKGELPPDALLLFRLGDFYEMFFEDAIEGARLLNVALTKRGTTPMCGIPFHAANGYIAKILRGGRKVAICDQVEEARPGQLVKREVTQILSPGTHFDDRILTAERNNFLAAVRKSGDVFGIAMVDLTTGDFRVTEAPNEQALQAELERLRPAELIYPDNDSSLAVMVSRSGGIALPHEGWVFEPETAAHTLREHFKVAALDGYGLRGKIAGTGAAGAALHYLRQHLRRDVAHLTGLAFYLVIDHLVLDSTTLRHLEVVEPLHEGARESTLFAALNRTTTPMGARLLRDWLTRPLCAVPAIVRRQDAVAAFQRLPEALEPLRTHLKEVRDLQRTLSRLSVGSGNARDLVSVRLALQEIPALRELAGRVAVAPPEPVARTGEIFGEEPASLAAVELLVDLQNALHPLPEVVEELTKALADEPPLALKEGGIIRDGYSPDLDELRSAGRDGKDWIARLQQAEIEKTGIPSLKVRFNSVFGYYIEITKSNLDRVPIQYIRKQTVANGERFITPELKEMEGKILGAEERSTRLEYDLFLKLREQVLAHLSEIQAAAAALAELDVLSSLAEHARLHGCVRPIVGDEGVLFIREGRHPVLSISVSGERFVPNDTEFKPGECQIALITGPNMAGKSTYIRQTALLALLAHTGAFLPAAEARVDLIDRIFTRIGASDDLTRGQSTFMVEMSETANILNNATARSLVVLDEIGRGTSTFDGLSLAWSIVEHLHHQVGAKTLFATHYHELTELAGRLPRLRNFNVAVREWNDQIIFLRKIVPGGADRSYGIQVARLAGVPKGVLERAKMILSNLEESELSPEGKPRPTRRAAERKKLQEMAPVQQLDLFG